ncbi:MAG TPA: hypothetical protein VJP79_00135 [Nitrososphaera sp.]|nr:hypothetical protein [Nitrososphaera sp.]
MKSESDGHSVHFAHYAAKLERHLRNNGITCHDADLVIEESSVLYFEKLRSKENSLVRLIRKREPSDLFVKAANKAIKKLLPGAQDTFGSSSEIARCIL